MADLIDDAKASLDALLQFKGARCEQWLMRTTTDGRVGDWELLTGNSEKNDAMIKAKICESKEPVGDLVLAFLGLVEWRGKKQLMANMQFFRHGYPTGLLYGSHLGKTLFSRRLRLRGGLLIMGGCQNLWI